ncbi:MAG: YgiT-type zinc finger protein [Armatimonadota bacterium]|nr:YgiT-type zinc finger protein [Armatimonadota bacterium]
MKETDVKCVVCKQGETPLGKATVTLDRDNLTLVVKGAPAQVCSNLYYSRTTPRRLSF